MNDLRLPRVAVLDDYLHVALESADWSALAGRCHIDVIDRHFVDEEEATFALAPYEVLCHMRERMPMPKSLIDRLPNLRFMTVTGKAHRTLDLAAATSCGVAVSNVSVGDPLSHGAPELAWGLVLAAARRISSEDRQIRAGNWQTGLGMELFGKTLGLLGLGALGQQVARYGQAFGMKVVAWSPNLTVAAASLHGVQYVDKSTLFAQSDVLSVHLVLGERTRHIVGAEELGLMKREAVLVNTSRGEIIEEAALVQALTDGWIAAAGLDVFAREPLPADHPLCALDNVVLTPHIGYATRETFRRFYEATVASIAAYLDGNPTNLLNPRLWHVHPDPEIGTSRSASA